MPFEFKKLEIPDVILIKPMVFKDDRGFFMETYKKTDFENFVCKDFVQENQSYSTKNTLRGLHYQKDPMAQGKLVRAIKGEIFDAAVDIRKDSPTYGKYVSEILSEENKKMIYIPEGFAHGFCVLSDAAEIVYLTTEVYAPEYDRGIIWNDADISIDWPVQKPVLSEKDVNLPELRNADMNFKYKNNKNHK